ncbi:hypothetical protein BTUL_0035g00660 [Botrytis tulipae]|uniref:Uncharacterized protein n=1 Tax=Botrytis tulipae TaxID=87230 RepID=A0A4Z1EWI8_9HELO|nr:hypothetical protein BTUL_0035g00660 [Botrytis tulipae]
MTAMLDHSIVLLKEGLVRTGMRREEKKSCKGKDTYVKAVGENLLSQFVIVVIVVIVVVVVVYGHGYDYDYAYAGGA